MITIDTNPTGETTLFIRADTIMAAIRTLDRARAALAALDDQELPPISQAAVEALIALRREAIAQAETAQEPPAPPPVAQEPAPVDISDAPANTLPAESPLDAEAAPLPAALAEPTVEELRAEIAVTGLRLFGEAWSDAHTWLVKLWTSHYTRENIRTTAAELDATECIAIIDGMVSRSQDTLAHWRKHLAEQEAKATAATVAAAARPAPPRGRQARTTASLTAPRREPSGRAAPTPAQVAAANNPVYTTG
jgi:hypothetical protein